MLVWNSWKKPYNKWTSLGDCLPDDKEEASHHIGKTLANTGSIGFAACLRHIINQIQGKQRFDQANSGKVWGPFLKNSPSIPSVLRRSNPATAIPYPFTVK